MERCDWCEKETPLDDIQLWGSVLLCPNCDKIILRQYIMSEGLEFNKNDD